MNIFKARTELMKEWLKKIFFTFYDRDVKEDDSKTCFFKIALTTAAVFRKDTKYNIVYTKGTVASTPFVNDII